jgi:hypothetical protein
LLDHPAEQQVSSSAMQKQCSPLFSAKSGDKLYIERRSIVATPPRKLGLLSSLTFSIRRRYAINHTTATLLLAPTGYVDGMIPTRW